MKFLLVLLLTSLLSAGSPRFIGDSLMGQMRSELSQIGTVIAFSGSGLSNPTLHNWIRDTNAVNPDDIMVVALGTNDAQSIPDGPFGSPEWKRLHEERVATIMSRCPAQRMLWVLPPRVGSKRFDQRLDRVRDSIRKTAFIMGVDILDAPKLLNEDERFNPRYHAPDRIHLNPSGIKLLAGAIKAWVGRVS